MDDVIAAQDCTGIALPPFLTSPDRACVGMNTEAVTGCPVSSRWRDRAACRGEDPELFFPVGIGGPALLQIAEAKRVCRGCPVVSECLVTALAVGDGGVRGGLSESEREAVSRARARDLYRAQREERAS